MKQGDFGKSIYCRCGVDWRRMEKSAEKVPADFSGRLEIVARKNYIFLSSHVNEVVHDPAHVAERCAGLLFNTLALARCNRIKHQHCRRADSRARNQSLYESHVTHFSRSFCIKIKCAYYCIGFFKF
jgi:hypothetical protein